MGPALSAAAAYNLAWGVAVVVFPLAMFRWLGMDDPRYPAVWQSLGMVVGVFGLGYAIAAQDVVRHWPIVFLGFLGKLLGALGFLYAAFTRELPWEFGLTILMNDVIWLVPFAAILYYALREMNAPALPVRPAELVALPSRRIASNMGESLADMSRRQPVLAIFLRHLGCTFCREALGDVARRRDEIERDGVKVAIVHMGERRAARELFRRYNIEDLPCYHDPNAELYREFGLQRGRFGQLFGPWVWWRGFQAAIVGRHGMGGLAGDGFQMPGVFLIENGEVVSSYIHRTAADRPDFVGLAVSRQSPSAPMREAVGIS